VEDITAIMIDELCQAYRVLTGKDQPSLQNDVSSIKKCFFGFLLVSMGSLLDDFANFWSQFRPASASMMGIHVLASAQTERGSRHP
jgi:hypothetical protein